MIHYFVVVHLNLSYDDFTLLTNLSTSLYLDFFISDERVGNLVVVLNDKSVIPQMRSQLTLIVRGMYSNPPNHGGRIVATVLNNPTLYEEWYVN